MGFTPSVPLLRSAWRWVLPSSAYVVAGWLALCSGLLLGTPVQAAQPDSVAGQVVSGLRWVDPLLPVLLLLLCAVGGARFVHLHSAYTLQARSRSALGLGGMPAPGESTAWWPWLGAGVAAAGLGALIYTLEGGWGHSWLLRWDAAWQDWVQASIPASWFLPLNLVTALGDVLITGGVALLGAVMLLRRKRWLEAQVWLFFCLFNGLLIRVLKLTFDRARPSNVHDLLVSGASFPSGHAASSVLVYVLLAIFVSSVGPRWQRLLLVGGALMVSLLIGVSRVLLSVHWFSDVLAGTALGLMSVLLAVAVLKQLRQAQA